MKKSLFNPLLLLAGLLVSNLSVAQVTPISGVVEPEISTAESPKWYTMMSSHLTASDRQNRFMKWDGSRHTGLWGFLLAHEIRSLFWLASGLLASGGVLAVGAWRAR